MRILALDAALGRCSAAVVADGALLAMRLSNTARGHAGMLPPMVSDTLQEAGIAATGLDLVGVTVGPGSFTGIRAALALAQGIALGAGCPVVGVTVAEALADSLKLSGARELWTAIDSRRGRVFLDRNGLAGTFALDALPRPDGPVALAGDAAIAVAARLAARDADVMLTDARLPLPRHVAMVAARRHAGEIAPLTARPLYIDPPEARPASGLRPAPA
jgi:tRNA threonylcarbamoyl adenosine modification protein YeaZ